MSRAAQSWPSATCQILTAKIQSHHDDDGTSYSAEFTYRYTVDGKTYNGDQLGFLDFSGSRSSAKRILDKFPKGSEQVCYYPPDEPENAILDRDNENIELWFIFLPFIFMLVGGGIMIAGIFDFFRSDSSISGSADSSNRTSSTQQTKVASPLESNGGELTPADLLDQEWSTPRKLKTASSRWVLLIFLGIFGLFWNGFIATFFFSGPSIWNDGFDFTTIFFTLFSIPFVLVGIGLMVGFGYLFLSLFNPKVEIALSSGAVPIGGEVDLAWEVEGKVERIKKLTIEIHGSQVVTYRRGTDTVTESTLFELIRVATVDDPMSIAFGSAAVQIPNDVVPTLEANNNKVIWSVNVKGDIPWSPDISESFPFRVTPDRSMIPVEKN